MESTLNELVESMQARLKRFTAAVEAMDVRREQLPLDDSHKARWVQMVGFMTSRKGEHDKLVEQFHALVRILQEQQTRGEKELAELQAQLEQVAPEKKHLKEQQALVETGLKALQAEHVALAAAKEQLQREKDDLASVSSIVNSMGDRVGRDIQQTVTSSNEAIHTSVKSLMGSIGHYNRDTQNAVTSSKETILTSVNNVGAYLDNVSRDMQGSIASSKETMLTSVDSLGGSLDIVSRDMKAAVTSSSEVIQTSVDSLGGSVRDAQSELTALNGVITRSVPALNDSLQGAKTLVKQMETNVMSAVAHGTRDSRHGFETQLTNLKEDLAIDMRELSLETSGSLEMSLDSLTADALNVGSLSRRIGRFQATVNQYKERVDQQSATILIVEDSLKTAEIEKAQLAHELEAANQEKAISQQKLEAANSEIIQLKDALEHTAPLRQELQEAQNGRDSLQQRLDSSRADAAKFKTESSVNSQEVARLTQANAMLEYEKSSLQSRLEEQQASSSEQQVSNMAAHVDAIIANMRQELTKDFAARLDGMAQKISSDDHRKSSLEVAVNALKKEHEAAIAKAQQVFDEKKGLLERDIQRIQAENKQLNQDLRAAQAAAKRKALPAPLSLEESPKRLRLMSDVESDSKDKHTFDVAWKTLNAQMGYLHPRQVDGSPVTYGVIINEVVPSFTDPASRDRVKAFLQHYMQTNWVCFAGISLRGHKDSEVAEGHCFCAEHREKCFSIRRWTTEAGSLGNVEFDFRSNIE